MLPRAAAATWSLCELKLFPIPPEPKPDLSLRCAPCGLTADVDQPFPREGENVCSGRKFNEKRNALAKDQGTCSRRGSNVRIHDGSTSSNHLFCRTGRRNGGTTLVIVPAELLIISFSYLWGESMLSTDLYKWFLLVVLSCAGQDLARSLLDTV